MGGRAMPGTESDPVREVFGAPLDFSRLAAAAARRRRQSTDAGARYGCCLVYRRTPG